MLPALLLFCLHADEQRLYKTVQQFGNEIDVLMLANVSLRGY